jgi:hypothetical protein
MFGFTSLAFTKTVSVSKLLLRSHFVGFAIVGTNTGSGTHKLAEKWLADSIASDGFRKPNYRFAKQRCSLSEIKRPVAGRPLIGR